jgi:hypothetical protein
MDKGSMNIEIKLMLKVSVLQCSFLQRQNENGRIVLFYFAYILKYFCFIAWFSWLVDA